MRHICFLTGCFNREDPLIIGRQGKLLVNAGYKVTYIVSDSKPDEVRDNINIVSTGFEPPNRLARMVKTRFYLANKLKDISADIFQISEPELLPLAVKLKKKGKIVVYNMREYYPDMMLSKSYLPKVTRKLISVLLEKYMSKSLKRMDAVFSVTPSCVDIVKNKWNCKHSYLLTNYPVVDVDITLSFEDYKKRGDVLCYIGNIYRCSRQEITFDALQKIPQLKYLLAGKLNGYMCGELERHPYWKNVEFIDGFSANELKNILRRGTIGNTIRVFPKNSLTGNGSLGVQ